MFLCSISKKRTEREAISLRPAKRCACGTSPVTLPVIDILPTALKAPDISPSFNFFKFSLLAISTSLIVGNSFCLEPCSFIALSSASILITTFFNSSLLSDFLRASISFIKSDLRVSLSLFTASIVLALIASKRAFSCSLNSIFFSF